MTAAELAITLEATDLQIVPARASDGNGVREAAVMAIRLSPEGPFCRAASS
jgi:hypothetical protein